MEMSRTTKGVPRLTRFNVTCQRSAEENSKPRVVFYCESARSELGRYTLHGDLGPESKPTNMEIVMPWINMARRCSHFLQFDDWPLAITHAQCRIPNQSKSLGLTAAGGTLSSKALREEFEQ